MSGGPTLEVVLIGDFSGRASRGAHAPQELGARKLRTVEPEEFDALFATLAVELRLKAPGASEAQVLVPRSLDDFAPDALWTKLASCEPLRSLRRRLENPATFEAAARELGAELATAPPPATSAGSAAPASALEAAMQATSERGPSGVPRTGEEIAQALVRELVIPHVVPAPHPQRDELLRAVDAAIAEHLRALLRDPALRRAEVAWRSLDFVLRRIGVANAVKLRVLDASREELASDLLRSVAIDATALHRVLAPRGDDPAEDRAVLWLGLETVDATLADAVLLARWAELARACGALLLAGAAPRLVGAAELTPETEPGPALYADADAARAWEALRTSAVAERISLAAPRLLLRLPYGERGTPSEEVAFEELEATERGSGYLWGSGALALAVFLGEQLAEQGAFEPSATRELGDLPLHVREEDGEPLAQPCAELLLRERDAASLAARGLSVLRSVRSRDSVYVGPLRSLSGRELPLP
ncbi:MAG: type VI secretion system contractile sheath large subunit [Planctomycetes bacterium]|nr:type VI secretion system contractile sheath large subunit [Planctomycetota bacterium]